MDPGAIHVRTMYHADTPCDITHPAYRVCACALALVSAENGWAGGHDQKADTKPTTPTTTAAGIRSVLILFHLRTAPSLGRAGNTIQAIAPESGLSQVESEVDSGRVRRLTRLGSVVESARVRH